MSQLASYICAVLISLILISDAVKVYKENNKIFQVNIDIDIKHCIILHSFNDLS